MEKILLITNYFPLHKSGEDIFLKEEYELAASHYDIFQKLSKNSILFPNSRYNVIKLFFCLIRYSKLIIFTIQNIRLEHTLHDLKKVFRLLRIINNLDTITNKYNNIYTYWNDEYTLALVLLKKFYKPNLKIISRIHGIDYIKERHKTPPFMGKIVFSNLDLIASQCKWSKFYIEKTYQVQLDNFFNIPIGVSMIENLNLNSSPNSLNIASCSNLIPLKNLSYHIELLSKIAVNHPERTIHYFILGSGQERLRLERDAIKGPKNLNVIFVGAIENSEIPNFYTNNEISFLIHLSLHEGGIH
jgi:hypothetical protein